MNRNSLQRERAKQFLRSFHLTSALWRFVESQLYRQYVVLKSPVLDLGCGDGLFAALTFEKRRIEAGVDISKNAIDQVSKRGIYNDLKVENACCLSFPSDYFNTVFSNCVLEHVPDIDKALKEVNRVLKKDGLFVFTVPTRYFNEYLFYSVVAKKIGLGLLAKIYFKMVNRILGHYHLLTIEEWKQRLQHTGFTLDRYCYLISARSMKLIDLVGFTKMWLVIKSRLFSNQSSLCGRLQANRLFIRYLVEESVQSNPDMKGAGLFIIAKKG